MMAWKRTLRTCVVVLAGVAMVGGFVSGQAPDPPQQPTFRTEANYVRVDVYPTIKGVPVDDLRADELQILEDGVPQKIEQFERVVIRGNLPQEARREPETVADSRAMLADPRARVFVLFLDTLHVEQSASRSIRKPLLEMLQRLIGPDDLVAVMTPRMSVADVTFARRTTILEGQLDRAWWGVRDSSITNDPVEEQYRQCYPADPRSQRTTSEVAQEMIDRRREKMTLEALENLALFLRNVREERKAIVTVTDGWILFRPNPSLTRAVDDRPPALPPITVDPRNGRLTTKDTTQTFAGSQSQCEQDRIGLSQLDDQLQFERLLDQANRANASFYPVDPRGLVAFDSPIGPDPPPGLQADSARLRQRSTSLRTLAVDTDGTAVVGTNEISRGLKRVVDDFSSYYLLGYYSTNTKLDGKFRFDRGPDEAARRADSRPPGLSCRHTSFIEHACAAIRCASSWGCVRQRGDRGGRRRHRLTCQARARRAVEGPGGIRLDFQRCAHGVGGGRAGRHRDLDGRRRSERHARQRRSTGFIHSGAARAGIARLSRRSRAGCQSARRISASRPSHRRRIEQSAQQRGPARGCGLS